MNAVSKAGLATLVLGLVLLAVAAGPLFAQGRDDSDSGMASIAVTHEQMHQMMDAMRGEGASERMHDAMGANAERSMDQCAAMMSMMQRMPTMMDNNAMPGMMEDQPDTTMPSMMNRMMGR